MNRHRPAYACTGCDTKATFEQAHASTAPPCCHDQYWEPIPAQPERNKMDELYECSTCGRAQPDGSGTPPTCCPTTGEWITAEEAERREEALQLEADEQKETTAWGDTVSTYESGAKRANGGKIRWDLMPVVALRDTAQIWTFGAEKYGDRNWEKGFEWSGPFASLMRHLQAWWAGEDYDKESGLSHLAHAACNLQMLQHFEYHYREGDNRPAGSCPPMRKHNEQAATTRDTTGEDRLAIPAPPRW